MRSISSLFLPLVFCAALASGQGPVNQISEPPVPVSAVALSDSDIIQQLEEDWLKAERTTDTAILDRILADDFVNLGPNGQAPGKAQLLKSWQPRAGQAPPYTVETSDLRVYVFDNTAVTAYAKTYTAKENGKVFHEDTTHVFTKDKGIWKLRASRSSFHQ
jgi:ketosteroid isomerase-like protein